jgi:hypothetical protein
MYSLGFQQPLDVKLAPRFREMVTDRLFQSPILRYLWFSDRSPPVVGGEINVRPIVRTGERAPCATPRNRNLAFRFQVSE